MYLKSIVLNIEQCFLRLYHKSAVRVIYWDCTFTYSYEGNDEYEYVNYI